MPAAGSDRVICRHGIVAQTSLVDPSRADPPRVPAMAVTLAIFAAAQIAMPLGVRPHLIPPDRTIATIESVDLDFGSLTATVVPGRPGAWILSSGAVNAAGQPVSNLPAVCQAAITGLKPSSPSLCMESRGLREAITYEPASRYWPLQGIETGIFGALALALAGFCFWRLGRRRT